MKIATAWRFASRELRGGLQGFRILLACLALGVAAIAAVGTIRASIQQGLAEKGSELLGGDAQMEFTYRFATDEERAWMAGNALAVSEVTDFRSMAVVGNGDQTERGLTQVKSVDDVYPLIGQITLDPDISLDQALAGNDVPGGVMDRVLVDRLGLSIGDTFRLGTQSFTLTALIVTEPDGAADGFMLGPRTLVRTADLADAGLLETGTLYSTKYRLDLPDGVNLAAVERQAEELFEETGMRWSDARNGAPGVREFVDRLGAFLVLVGLSGLAVGGVGVSAAVRSYLARKTSVIATLKTLGADRSTIFLTYFMQIGVLTVLGIILGIILGGGIPVLLGSFIEARLPVPADFTLHPMPLIEAALYGTLAALIFTLWPLARADDIRAATLFRDALDGNRKLPALRYLIAIGALLTALVGSAMWFSGTVRLTLWTAGGVMGVLIVLSLSAIGIRYAARVLARRSFARGRTRLRLALASIGGPRDEATSVVLSLGLGLSVLAAVGQIDGNLRNAIATDLPEVAPSYFFVDIQNDQLPGFLDRLENDDAVSNMETAPMLRGVISRINGRPAREVAGDHWVITGDRGVTYAASQPENTTVTEGEWWPDNYTGAAQISFAEEEALEMGLGIGDELTVNVLGRDIVATITSLRVVDFSNAGIGFVMTMNEAALVGAPHTHIATVYAEPEAEARILRDLANAYPNITAIRVRDAIALASDVLAGIAAATSYGAGATLLTGFMVLIGAAAAGQAARTYEAAILKTVGAGRKTIFASFIMRAALLGGAAGIIALIAGISAGWAVSTFIMETGYSVMWSSALIIVIGGVLANMLAGLAFTWRPLAARPAQILRAKE
ncbi:ABC transporter permease [Parasulfitobacter algicola]|uniref:FtsX-like permease family protein n=1 Tax=Parasulfitobacter algicola TaxID=2614809 RepID=A0ABX2IMJ1_9RHOB|nr:FtsX-like permease family protein [Sulfitobacter algicola]NSX54094.1 FtsX-like permease family protein [Sulfitobacter algicola]